MVSSKSRPYNSADHMEESNTTASLFLGGMRMNWMGPQINAPEKSATRNPRVELPVLPNSLPRELVLMFPVTPGETPPSRGPVHTKNPDTRATALPSPALSTNSHPSPVGADAIISSRPYTLPQIPTLSTTQRGNDECMAVQPPPSGLATSQRVTQFPLMGPNWSTNSPPRIGTCTGASTEHTASGSRPSPQQNGGAGPGVIPNKTWQQWSVQLDALVVSLRTEGALLRPHPGARNVIGPRINLLRQAINRKDAFYLVMHQLYCRYSIDSTTLGQIRAPKVGMEWLKRLLEDNGMMHDAATIAFAHFPDHPQRLMQTKWYLQVLSGIPEFLLRLETEWQSIWRHPPHTPLVSHLWEALACPSPILMSVMFMCVARRLHNEKDTVPLLELFWKNFTAFKQCMEAKLPGTTQQSINSHFAQEYCKFPRSSEYLSQTPSSSHSAPPRPQIQTMSQAASGAPSPYPRSSVAGISQPVVHSPALSPLGGTLQESTSNSPHGPVASPATGSLQFGVNSQVQNTPQHHYYNPTSQGQGQGQRQGQWHPVNSHMNSNMNPQMQMHMQTALGQISPFRTHHSPRVPHGQQMQRRAMMPTTSVLPVDPSPQLCVLTSTQPAQSLHAPSTVSATSTTTNHVAQQPVPSPRPNNYLNRQHLMNSQPSASPIMHAPQRQQLQPSPNTAFLPVPGYRAPMMVNPNPMRLGLHLVDLRDPMKKLVKYGSHGNDIVTDLFTYPDTFVVHPTVINVDQPTYTWNFSFTHDERQRFPHIASGQEGQHSVWTFRPGCRNIRLRCIRLPGNPDTVTEQTWSTTGTFWPSVFYITVNGTELYVRRKVHNGKDLPLDITEYLRIGENSVRLDMILGQDECKTSKYVFGVEAMEVAEFDQLLSLVKSLPAADSRAAIQKRLCPITDDDDLAVVTDNLTIDLVDPFMARIFDVPVRSRHCNHHECFDRDTFIITRKSVSGPTPMVDNWRCPICKADARPQFLVVDQFLAEIHAQLTRTNRLDGVRAIQIKVDGTWTPKYDTDETSPEVDKHFSLKRKAENTPGPVAMRPRIDVFKASRSPAVRMREPNPTVIELD
ncbi:Zinc finger MIZ-type [Penicillium robsamsonii]|uniref:Zinc finger MIZ-type n=1 Tax=Penicillium robsamsonii TaxID=1792511 RepID=UPI002548A4EB|nr:Zinc finger MIZ-type [Penicillium robsamsonii]KAJ5834735.1 Zinc finger MIZ-type [Penicillium robsamsonii]